MTPWTRPRQICLFRTLPRKSAKTFTGMRIGLLRSIYEDNCDPKLLGPYNEALKKFEELGAEIIDVPFNLANPATGH